MAAATKIQWADHTFNPWIGCSKVSEGCKHCYAAALANARPAFVLGPGVPRTKDGKKLPIWGDEAPRRMTGAAYWRQPAKWNRGAQAAGERRRVFCASLADFFEDKPGLDEIRTLVYEQILATPWLDWLLLTK